MSKEKQIDEMARSLNEATFGVNVHTLADHLHPETIHKVAEYLYNAGYRKQGEWISVDERLPEDGVWVLGYSAKSGRGGLCNCLKSYIREFGNYDDTTHWLPLPKFPKKKGQ